MHILWSLMTRRVTGVSLRHPERYREMFHIARKNRLHRVARELNAYRNGGGVMAWGRNGRMKKARYAENFAMALEELGPCFIKFGQLLSTRPDLLPPDYIAALARLQDCVAPIPGGETLNIVESELGGPVEAFFSDFDCQPVAVASMAQVHRAVLADGTLVAVKVLRPGVRRQIEVDPEVLHDLVHIAAGHNSFNSFGDHEQMVRELDISLRSEMDYLQELENTEQIGHQLSGFQLLATPEIYRQYSTGRVLTLSFIQGKRLSNLTHEELEMLDREAIARELLSAYLQQIVVDGSFHCDPHPGNILIMETGQLALLDFGMIGRFDMEEKDTIILLLLAFAERQGRRVAEIYLDMLDLFHTPDRRAFTEDVESLVSRISPLEKARKDLNHAVSQLSRGMLVGSLLIASGYVLGSWLRIKRPES